MKNIKKPYKSWNFIPLRKKFVLSTSFGKYNRIYNKIFKEEESI